MEISTIFEVTEFKTGDGWRETIDDEVGQAAVRAVRKLYPRHTKFVLAGFEINGIFVPLYIKNRFTND